MHTNNYGTVKGFYDLFDEFNSKITAVLFNVFDIFFYYITSPFFQEECPLAAYIQFHPLFLCEKSMISEFQIIILSHSNLHRNYF